MIDLKAFQAWLDAVEDVHAGVRGIIWAASHRTTHLVGDHHILAVNAEISERLTDDRLQRPGRVDIGNIDEVDAVVEHAVDQRLRMLQLDIAHVRPEPLAAKVMVPRQPVADWVMRMVQLRDTPAAIPILYPALKPKFYYWLLSGPNSAELCKQAMLDSHLERSQGQSTCCAAISRRPCASHIWRKSHT